MRNFLFLFIALQFHCSLLKAQISSGAIVLLPAGVKGLINADTLAIAKVLKDPSGDTFQIDTYTKKAKSNHWKTDIKQPIAKGDILWLHLKARCLKSKRETGEAFIEILLNRIVDGKYLWPPLLERGESIGSNWVTIEIPFIAENAVQATDYTSFVLNFGDMPQVVEVKDLMLLNYNRTVKYSDLPKSTVHYKGDEPDAPWRKAAAERIEKYRKGDLLIKVVDKKGKPIPNARIHVNLTHLDFAIGTATNSRSLLDTLKPESKKYRDTLFRYFNKVVFENEVKWQNWDKRDHGQTFKALDLLKKYNIPVRGHVMVWPSWEHSPAAIRNLKDTSAIASYIINSITRQTKDLQGRFIEWDVVNEPYAHHDYLDILGRHKMIEWFKTADKGAPDVKLFLNDYTMFHGEGPNSASERFFENVKYLKENGAPIDAIGEQGHIGGSPPGMEYIISRLDRFAELGLPIQISEFDITSDDDDFKKRYLKDFMTAVFSHPITTGIMQWGFWAGQHWIPSAALWDKNWNLRSHGKAFAQIVTKDWTTQAEGITDIKGNYTVRGFNGTYTITVAKGKSKSIKTTTLNSKGTSLTVVLN